VFVIEQYYEHCLASRLAARTLAAAVSGAYPVGQAFLIKGAVTALRMR
jgi:hypothetical protein